MQAIFNRQDMHLLEAAILAKYNAAKARLNNLQKEYNTKYNSLSWWKKFIWYPDEGDMNYADLQAEFEDSLYLLGKVRNLISNEANQIILTSEEGDFIFGEDYHV